MDSVSACSKVSRVGAGILGIGQVVEELVVFAGSERRVEREVVLGDGEGLLHLLHRDVHALGDLGRRGLAAQLLEQRGRPLADAVERPRAVERHPHDAALLGQRLEDGLPDPPDRVGDELDALGLVELVRRADEAEVALVDQVGQRHALVLILLGHGDDEAEVAAHELVQRLAVAGADALGEIHFLFLRDQRILADLAEILVQRSFIERRAPPASTDLHWTHATRPRTGWRGIPTTRCVLVED